MSHFTPATGDTDFFFSHRNDFEKIAVVGNPRWEAQVLAFTGAGLRKGPVKFFLKQASPRPSHGSLSER